MGARRPRAGKAGIACGGVGAPEHELGGHGTAWRSAVRRPHRSMLMLGDGQWESKREEAKKKEKRRTEEWREVTGGGRQSAGVVATRMAGRWWRHFWMASSERGERMGGDVLISRVMCHVFNGLGYSLRGVTGIRESFSMGSGARCDEVGEARGPAWRRRHVGRPGDGGASAVVRGGTMWRARTGTGALQAEMGVGGVWCRERGRDGFGFDF